MLDETGGDAQGLAVFFFNSLPERWGPKIEGQLGPAYTESGSGLRRSVFWALPSTRGPSPDEFLRQAEGPWLRHAVLLGGA